MTNSMFLKFHSDISRVGGGFYLTWDGTSTGKTYNILFNIIDNSIKHFIPKLPLGCGGTLTSSHGSIISPNYPQPYAHNAQCNWKISVSSGSVIDLIIADMDLEDRADCFFDYVIVRVSFVLIS